MEISILIARIACLVYLAAAVGGFVNPGYYRRIVDDMFRNSAVVYIAGFFTVILGSLIVQYHNLWVGDWRVLITAIGWIAVIKGMAIIAIPEQVRRISEPFVTGTGQKIFPVVALILALLFGCFGFLGAG